MVGTINKELTQVVTVLNKAAKVWRWLPLVPTIEHLKGAEKRAYPFSWDEQDRLFSRLPTGWDVGLACFAVNTGCRQQEMLTLKWSQLRRIPELGPDIFVFVLSETKNSEERAVICNSIARRAVEHQRKWQAKHGQSEYVFPSKAQNNRGGKINATGRVWKLAWLAAGLPSGPLVKKGIHNCRHTFAFRLRAAGVPEEDRNALLGHARTNLAQHYAPGDIERLLAHAEKVCERKEMTLLRAVG